MISATSHINLNQSEAEAVLAHCRDNTEGRYLGNGLIGHLFSYKLLDTPHFSLLEGFAVPPHNDDRPAFRPLLCLNNPQSNYTLRGAKLGSVQATSPQKRGSVSILDLEAPHEMYCNDPWHAKDVWSFLEWSPNGNPISKNSQSPQAVANAARIVFLNFIREHARVVSPR